MQDRDIGRIRSWLMDAGMDAMAETDIVGGFGRKCVAAGLPLASVIVIIDTLHPIHEGRAFRWDGTASAASTTEYGPTIDSNRRDFWEKSAFYYLLSSGESEVRRRIGFGDPVDFSNLVELRDSGHTDVIAMAKQFSAAGSVGEMDCFYSNYTTTAATGFSDEDAFALRKLMPALGLAIKCVSFGRIARTIAEVYLGKDAAERVLAGKIRRGVSEKISSVLWFSDLTNFTKISDTIDPNEIIPFLNDYAEAAIMSIEQAGGTVLKLVGDGILAIFRGEDTAAACLAALDAEEDLRLRLKQLNDLRCSQQKTVTQLHLGLHVGDVFYGNVGSDSRLDFTVIGPAVNEVCRIAAMCRPLNSPILMSAQFTAALPPAIRGKLASMGLNTLRGVSTPIELFTLGQGSVREASFG